jgi:hypothetical protein
MKIFSLAEGDLKIILIFKVFFKKTQPKLKTCQNFKIKSLKKLCMTSFPNNPFSSFKNDLNGVSLN